MPVIMSNVLNMEFVQALNPLYAFPIVAVILCAFIVYAFGFKSPVQPPSFDGIEEEKKISKKKKSKDTNKTKIVQNGKQNGSMSNKNTPQTSMKKKDAEKSITADKPVIEKNVNEKKVSKKTKSNERKAAQEKKKEVISQMQEDAGEDGWVQLISKKGRKNRKKDEMVTTESQTVIKPLKNSQVDKTDEIIPAEDLLADVVEKVIPEKQLEVKDDKDDIKETSIEKEEKVVIEDDSTVRDNIENIPAKNILKNEKLNEEGNNKSKKKKKKNAEVLNKDIEYTCPSESPAVQVIPEVPLQNPSDNITTETAEIITENLQESEIKEVKSSNVVFDELEGLYPKEKEQKKKKKVRRDH